MRYLRFFLCVLFFSNIFCGPKPEDFKEVHGITMVRISKTKFTMGYQLSKKMDDKPVREREIFPFQISTTEISNARYAAFLNEAASSEKIIIGEEQGSFMKKVEIIGEKSSSKYGWIKPLRFIGIMLFVMVPFQGSGGMGGSILGRLIGMKPWNTLLSITLGAIIGCTLLAYFAETIKSVFLQNAVYGILIIVILIIISAMIYVYRRNNLKKNK